jgi:hypothetical protein
VDCSDDVRPCEGFRRFFLRGRFPACRDFLFQPNEVVTPAQHLPSKVSCLSKYSYVFDHWGSSDSPEPAVPSPFPTGVGRSSLRTPSATNLRKPFHPSLDFLPRRSTSISVPHRTSPTFLLSRSSILVHLPWGSRSLLATSTSRIVTAPGLPLPVAFRSWRSSRLQRFAPRPALRVYFTPQPL